MKHLAWVGLCLTLAACAALPQFKDTITGNISERSTTGPLYRYRADLILSLENKRFEGMAVTKLTGPLQIKIDSKVKLHYMTINSCGREDVIRDVDKSFTYTYIPTKKELEGLCPLYIKAFDEAGLTAWGFIAFRKDEELPSHVDCNGVGWAFAGITVCQSRAGLEQQLTFQQDIQHWESDAPCKINKVDSKTFDLRSDPGFCLATFYSSGKWHRLIFLNYEKPLVR